MCDGEPSAPALALVVGAARSGTTLTRLLLDAHPDIGCPAEAGLPALMAHQAQVWRTVNADGLATQTPRDPGVELVEADAARQDGETDRRIQPRRRFEPLPAHAREWIAATVRKPMSDYCMPRGKRIYCDKSLDSVNHLPLVCEIFPSARVLLVFRHVMDTIASGIEASPWGFNAYGYAPYVQSNAGNTVAALASYWLDHVSRALEWEKDQRGVSYRVRYEDLVREPSKTVAGIQRFLGVTETLAVLTSAFQTDAMNGPADYKIEHTTSIQATSIGHGKRVPFQMLPTPLVTALNERLEILGYEPLTPSWNATERAVDSGGEGIWATRLHELMKSMRCPTRFGGQEIGSFAVLAEDHRGLRWVIDPARRTINHGDGEVDAVLTGTAEDLVLTLTAEENVGVLLRSGRLRHVVADPEEADPRALLVEIRGIIDLLRDGLHRGRNGGS